MLADKIEHYKQTKTMLRNTPAQYKKEFDWLKEVDSLALANTQLNLDKAYKNFFGIRKRDFLNSRARRRIIIASQRITKMEQWL
jgi:putative transposase